jgi:hypothetical protein
MKLLFALLIALLAFTAIQAHRNACAWHGELIEAVRCLMR